MESSIDLYAEEYAADYDVENEQDTEIVQDEHQSEQGETENENVENKGEADEEKKKVKPKRVIKNPRPKLNLETLRSHKGLMCLEKYFKNKKFKGSGHEEEDLKTIMKTYEYWCHRLFPKFSFDDCLSHLEKLGTKKNVQVFLKRIRMDMVFEDEQFVKSDNEEDTLDRINSERFDNLLVQPNPEDENSIITEEQIERIRLNKERAYLLRQEKLQKQNEQIAVEAHQEDYIEAMCSEISEENSEIPSQSESENHTSTVQKGLQECDETENN